jgi:hypothetical protein
MGSADFWYGKSRAEWEEIWRLERLREDEMLAFYDEVIAGGGRITKKALAEKFNLTRTRTQHLIRRRVEARERARMFDERERMHAEIERLKEAPTFTGIAERLWMTLGWLAAELEKRRVDQAGGPA